MSDVTSSITVAPASQSVSLIYQLTGKLLGGRSVVRRHARNEAEAHILITHGIPTRAMLRLVDDLVVLST